MASSRFFVANLPPNTKEKDLTALFQDYGRVERVELKTKENPVEPESVKIIAFVTLKINADDAEYCVNELNWRKINGAKIKVSLAKESFLERLKREREEAEAAKAEEALGPQASDVNSDLLLTRKLENTRKTFTENELDDADNDDGIAPELLITKRRAANSLYNGKIVIQSYDCAPIHVIETQRKKVAKSLPEKGIAADQKRKESMNKKKNQYKQKKSTIQQALSGLDCGAAKKIKFSDAEDDEAVEEATYAKSKTNILDSDGDDNEDDVGGFSLKPELFGKKGEQLLQMQSKQSLDPRFRIDAKFVDDADDNDADEGVEASAAGGQVNGETETERSWQMGILEQVMGTKIDSGSAGQRSAKNKRMLRFDPAKEGHQKLLRTKTTEDDAAHAVPAGKKKKQAHLAESESAAEAASTAEPAPKVSKEVFYMVTDTLAQSLKSRGDGFSLLKMFGEDSSPALEQREDELKKVSNAKILVNKLDKSVLNPFSYDSSSEGETDNEVPATQPTDEQQAKNTKQKQQPVKLAVESFFIPRNDVRLKEGAQFFRFDKKQAAETDYEEVRTRLKMLIRTKISKAKKNTMSSGAVGRKRKNKYHK